MNQRLDEHEKYHQHKNVNKRQPVIHQYPENQRTFTKVAPQPGPISCSGTVKSIKKVALYVTVFHNLQVCTMSGINWGTTKYIKNAFLVLTQSQLNHRIIPTLCKDKPDTVIIHVGVNDLMNGTDRDDLIL